MTEKEVLKDMVRETKGRLNRTKLELMQAKIIESFAIRKSLSAPGEDGTKILESAKKPIMMLETKLELDKELLEFLENYEK